MKKILLLISFIALIGCYNKPQDFYDDNMRSECAGQQLYYDPLTGRCTMAPH
ncbi:MAG: hypothetical protein FWF67_02845 [Fibromonadales bacterium]|nr:hypothetical protein [Fibromonadales bacterium]